MKQQIEFDSDGAYPDLPAFLDRNATGDDTALNDESEEEAADNAETGKADTDRKDDKKYLAAVERGRAITASISGKQWLLGDEADNVGTVYGENKLEQYAEDIHFDGVWTTLQRYRDVCRAFPKDRGRPRYFASAQVLAPYPEPERFEIVERNPDISEREAREIMRKWRGSQEEDGDDQEEDDDQEEGAENEEAGNATGSREKKTKARASKRKNKETEAQRNAKRTLKQLREIAENAARLAAFAGEEIAPDRLRDYAAYSSDRTLIEDLRKGGTALLDAAEFLANLSTKAATVADG